MIIFIAELAGEVGLALFPDEGGQLLPAHADEGTGDPVPGAVAPVLHRVLLQNFQLEVAEDRPQQALAVQSAL